MKGWEIKNRQVWKWFLGGGLEGGFLGFCETTGVGFVFEKRKKKFSPSPKDAKEGGAKTGNRRAVPELKN
jgi:hypothetical protein